MTTVTYIFADGTKQVCQINNAIKYNEKGRLRSPLEIIKVFETTAHDLGAISFEL